MPIRFIDGYGRLGRAAVTLEAMTAAMTGDYSEPLVFTGAMSTRLGDLNSMMVGQYLLVSDRQGAISGSMSGVNAALRGDIENNPLYPPPTVVLEIL